MNLSTLSLFDIIKALDSWYITQIQLWEHFANISSILDPKLDIYNHQSFSRTTPQWWPLSGIPMTLKDLFNEVWVPTTASSNMLKNYISLYESTATARLKKAWMLSLGKVNCDEFAMWVWENSALRMTKNPWDITRVAGWSSSGSAAAVASWMSPISIWTDTGGSVRQPAALCWVVWFKWTYGSISRYGVIPMASSLDTIGVLSRTVRDAHIVWDIMQGHDSYDATTLNGKITVSSDIWERTDLKWIKIGFPKEYFQDGIEKGTLESIENVKKILRDKGAELVDISLPSSGYWVAAYYIIVPSEVSTNLARYDSIRFGHITEEEFTSYADWISHSRSEGFWPEAKRRIMVGSFSLSSGFYDAYYHRASLVREKIRREFSLAYSEVDVIATPVSPHVAWKIGSTKDDPIADYMADIFTVPWSLAGLPGISIPIGYSNPSDDSDVFLPVGLQILWPRLWEEKVFMVSHVLENSLKEMIHSRRPQIFW